MRALLLRALLRFLALLPLRAAHGIGAALGWLLAVIPNDLRRVAHANLALCLPELEAPARRRLVRQHLMEMAKTVTELGALWLWPPRRVQRLVRRVSGEEHILAGLRRGRGVILVIPHLGAWEMVGLYCAAVHPGEPSMTSLYRPLRIPGLEQRVRRARERTGGRLVPTGAGGVKALFEALRSGRLAGVLPDQDPGRGRGVFAPFFGVPANTMVLVGRLARRSDAPAVTIYAERLPRGAGFHIHIAPVDRALHDPDPVVSATALNRAVETAARECPAQYQWSYKRFRIRPDGEPPPYDSPPWERRRSFRRPP